MTKIDETYIKKKAEHVSEDDIRYVVEHKDEIAETFVGRGPFGRFIEEILLALYMVVDFGRGRYRKIPYWAIAAVVFMLLYVGNPVDVIPDFLIGIGQIDDVIVITLCLLMVRQELHNYKAWKAQQPDDDDYDDLDADA